MNDCLAAAGWPIRTAAQTARLLAITDRVCDLPRGWRYCGPVYRKPWRWLPRHIVEIVKAVKVYEAMRIKERNK